MILFTGFLLIITLSHLQPCCCRSSIQTKQLTVQDVPDSPKSVSAGGLDSTLPMPTVVYNCSTDFVAYIDAQASLSQTSMPSTQSSPALKANLVTRFIDGLCRSYGDSFNTCLMGKLPTSNYTIDQILNLALDVSTLPHILEGTCNKSADLNRSMECIISSVYSNPMSVQCMTNVGLFFDSILIVQDVHLLPSTQNFCKKWGRMISCIEPYIAICDSGLAVTWADFGKHILSATCRMEAFEKPRDLLLQEDTSESILNLFTTNTSALAICAQEFNSDMLQLMPTSIFNHSVNPADSLIAINAVCGDQVSSSKVPSFMYCLDERRLNATSAVDNFMFQIVSTVNIRMAYNKMCSHLQVLRSNINCLVRSAMELKTCMCFMSDLIQKIVELSAQGSINYDQFVNPFCGFYVSFAECYVNMLRTCNNDLGTVMKDLYLGALTQPCLDAKAGTCSRAVPVGVALDVVSPETPALYKCGVHVSDFVNRQNRSNSTDMHVMMRELEDLVIRTYNYTCSIGEELLVCLTDNFLLSNNTFDRLILSMFDATQMSAILAEGCKSSLIQDVKSRLSFLLSSILSDSRTAMCIEALGDFGMAIFENITLDTTQAIEPYCRVWGDFSECMEAKLSCTSPQLAQTWRRFTVHSLNHDCLNIAIDQQTTNEYLSVCDVHPIDDSVVSTCGMAYMEGYIRRNTSRGNSTLPQIVVEEIDYFCARDMTESITMIECLQTTLPASFLTLDRLVMVNFDLRHLSKVVTIACQLQPVLERRMGCIVESMEKDNGSTICIQHLVSSFEVRDKHNTEFTTLQIKSCRSWNAFVVCINHYIGSCDSRLSHEWLQASRNVMSGSCQRQIDAEGQRGAGSHARTDIQLVILTIVACVLQIVEYS